MKRRLSSGIEWIQDINVINYIRLVIKKKKTANNQKIFPGRKKQEGCGATSKLLIIEGVRLILLKYELIVHLHFRVSGKGVHEWSYTYG
ncbi:hypothetical protein DP119_06510 [Planococcus maitriensis]|uniref:Uncharacterized protein n=1 Tax=Planococcus maitriensis TaxID=221799 RepID=A0A365K6P5_9BACL|nr:hypothetical protein DP119_06510 [Planococcus maitriensis]